MKKLLVLMITVCMVFLISFTAFAHSSPEVYLDIKLAGSVNEASIIDLTSDNYTTYVGGFALPVDISGFMFKIWGEWSNGTLEANSQSINMTSSEYRVGIPVVHEETLHIHPCISTMNLALDGSSYLTEVNGVVLGANVVIGVNDQSDIEGFIGYSILGASLKSDNVSLADPSVFVAKAKYAFSVGGIELAVGYRWIGYSAKNFSGNQNAITLGILYGIPYPSGE